MSTLIIKEDGTRYFTNEKSHLADGLLWAFAAQKANMSEKETFEFLNNVIPQNTCLDDFIDDVKLHSCSNKVIVVDDNGSILGFMCEGCGTKWRIPLADFKAYMHWKRDLREVLRTTEGRKEWVKQFSK